MGGDDARGQRMSDWPSGRYGRRLEPYVTATRRKWESRNNARYRRAAAGYELPDGSRRIYHYHIRKTAGTSLHWSFLELGGEEPSAVMRRMERSALGRTISGRYVFAAHRSPVLATGEYFLAWSHAPAHSVVLPPHTFTFTVLRDPADRVVSLYRYLLGGDDPDMTFRVEDDERSGALRGFDHFLDTLPRRDLLRQLFTFSRRFDVNEAADTLAGCSSVFTHEAFERGSAELARRLDLPLRVRHERASRGAAPPLDAQLDRLGELLEPEYQLLQRVGLDGSERRGARPEHL
jgi:hypothetical protein